MKIQFISANIFSLLRTQIMTDNGFPCMRCQLGTVVHKSPLTFECQTCFASMPTPHHEEEHDAAIKDDDELLHEILSETTARVSVIQLVGERYDVRRPIRGGACPQCGQLIAWQTNFVTCPSCQAEYRTGPRSKIIPYMLMLSSVYMFTFAGITSATTDRHADAIALLVGGCAYLLIAVGCLVGIRVDEQKPLIDYRSLTAAEVARLAPDSWPPQML